MNSEDSLHSDFEYAQIYHLFSRVNGSEILFRNEENFRFFLNRVSKYLLPVLDIYAYCLLPQRFSFLVCFRSQDQICSNYRISPDELAVKTCHQFLMQPLSNLLNSYSKAYNKRFQRKGALFVDYIKREKIEDPDLLKETFRKIHRMPVESGVAKQIEDWKFSSYNVYKNAQKPTQITREPMLKVFSDLQELLDADY